MVVVLCTDGVTGDQDDENATAMMTWLTHARYKEPRSLARLNLRTT